MHAGKCEAIGDIREAQQHDDVPETCKECPGVTTVHKRTHNADASSDGSVPMANANISKAAGHKTSGAESNELHGLGESARNKEGERHQGQVAWGIARL